ncbi:putative E3 ubiquitin-protein ligase HERC1 [Babylonia areolata]|uniref:putative E3 ubiquitin-protein ligase HERC1 n=1 Tax=Babylonia areolata TaxID=304850 RepID=UPI003FD4DA72
MGLGDSNNQPFPMKLVLEPKHGIKKISSSKGSDGHTLALSVDGICNNILNLGIRLGKRILLGVWLEFCDGVCCSLHTPH